MTVMPPRARMTLGALLGGSPPRRVGSAWIRPAESAPQPHDLHPRAAGGRGVLRAVPDPSLRPDRPDHALARHARLRRLLRAAGCWTPDGIEHMEFSLEWPEDWGFLGAQGGVGEAALEQQGNQLSASVDMPTGWPGAPPPPTAEDFFLVLRVSMDIRTPGRFDCPTSRVWTQAGGPPGEYPYVNADAWARAARVLGADQGPLPVSRCGSGSLVALVPGAIGEVHLHDHPVALALLQHARPADVDP
jgi:hypothetical protein